MYLRIAARAGRTCCWVLVPLLTIACPIESIKTEYDRGFDAGFALDEWYWQGYFDGFDTTDWEPVYYQGGTIPLISDDSYEAGYWDGVWYAYNDGYFVDYHYAFLLGFSEGYDNAYWPDYLDFLAGDIHVEYGHGGWIDGYHDGFSEGRVFGASDFEQGLPFDWLDALRDYESGTDLYFEEVDVGTGIYGPVVLYEYGTDPAAPKSHRASLRPALKAPRAIRPGVLAKSAATDPESIFRPMIPAAAQQLDVRPSASFRSERALRLDATWLERIQTYSEAKRAPTGNLRMRTAPSPISIVHLFDAG